MFNALLLTYYSNDNDNKMAISVVDAKVNAATELVGSSGSKDIIVGVPEIETVHS